MSHSNDPAVITRLLTEKGRWAVAGLSNNSARTAYGIAAYVRDLGHEIVPVHPTVSRATRISRPFPVRSMWSTCSSTRSSRAAWWTMR